MAKLVDDNFDENWKIFGAYDIADFYLKHTEEGIFLARSINGGEIVCRTNLRGFAQPPFHGSREELEALVGKENIHAEDGKQVYVVYIRPAGN